MGRSRAWVSKHLDGKNTSYYSLGTSGKADLPPPLREVGLSADAKRALEDFRYFREKYFQRATPNFQLEVADTITGLDAEESLLAFWPPGHGKTTEVTHDYPIWRMLRARAKGQRFACLLISKSGTLGRSFLLRIKRTLEYNRDLQMDFGWFKPEHPDMWTRDQLQVDGFDPELQGKEPTFIAAGSGTHIYGWRVDLIICDDLIDKESGSNVDRMVQLQEWFHEEVESRLEKGASLAVCGTRFSMQDLYGRLLELKDEDTEQPLYKVVLFPAHDTGKCPGPEGPHDEWPHGCLLWPEQKSYKSLMLARSKMGTGRFDFVYNQVESSTDDNLLDKAWVEEAKDKSRVLWDIPRGVKVVCTLDPSPTQYAWAQCWGLDVDTKKRYLIASKRSKMTVSQMIDLITEWTLRLRKHGKEPKWIFEQNAAQRWLFQSADYRVMRQDIGVTVQPHTTGRNKADPDYGIQILGPLYEFGMISLPWGDPDSRSTLAPFISELISYPGGATNDGVMAEWFFEWNIRKIDRHPVTTYTNPDWAPEYLKEHRTMYNPNSARISAG